MPLESGLKKGETTAISTDNGVVIGKVVGATGRTAATEPSSRPRRNGGGILVRAGHGAGESSRRMKGSSAPLLAINEDAFQPKCPLVAVTRLIEAGPKERGAFRSAGPMTT
jgi:hypothetical protein